MKIGLIAPENNGKTSYLIALYAVLVQDRNSEQGYPLRFSVDDPIQRRWFDDQFSRLVDEDLLLCNEDDPGAQRFPRKTSDEVTNYGITIKERTSSFQQKVTLVDFPGGVIRGVASEGQTDLHRRMLNDLTECDAFIVLLDAEALLSRKPYESKKRLSPSNIEDIILKAIAGSASRRFSKIGVPIAFCMSMADKVASLYAGDAEVWETAYERVLGLFPTFFEPEHRHPVLITAVSLGENIEVAPDGEDGKGRKGGKGGKGGPFEPFMIEKPFEFCVAFGALSAMTGSHEERAKWAEVAEREDARRNRARGLDFWDTVGEWFSTPAKIGQTPAEYWEEQRDISRRLEGNHAGTERNYGNVVSVFLQHLRDPEDTPHYSVYYGGQLNEITPEIRAGQLPLKPIE